MVRRRAIAQINGSLQQKRSHAIRLPMRSGPVNAPLCNIHCICALLDVPPSQSLLLDRQAAALFCLCIDLCVKPFAF